jgi:hypothetical protein
MCGINYLLVLMVFILKLSFKSRTDKYLNTVQHDVSIAQCNLLKFIAIILAVA